MKSVKLKLGLISGLLFSQLSVATDFLPHLEDDYSIFKSSNGQVERVSVESQYGTHWQRYSAFLGHQSQWIWTDKNDDRVYWLNSQGEVNQLVDFSDPIGTEYLVGIDQCSEVAKLSNNLTTVETRAGVFNNAAEITFSGNCMDGGLLSATFVAGVGLIEWQTQSIAGPVSYSLTRAKINQIAYPRLHGLQLAAEIDSGPIFTSETKTLNAYITLTNQSPEQQSLVFNSGQKFEIELISEQGEVVKQWSEGKFFTEAIETITINPGESIELGDSIGLEDSESNLIDLGQYSLKITVKGYDPRNPLGSAAQPFKVEVPVEILN